MTFNEDTEFFIGIPRKKRPEPKWKEPAYGYGSGCDVGKKDLPCDELCGSNSKFEISKKLRDVCCDINGQALKNPPVCNVPEAPCGQSTIKNICLE